MEKPQRFLESLVSWLRPYMGIGVAMYGGQEGSSASALPLKAAAKGAKAESRRPPLFQRHPLRAVIFGGRHNF